MNDAEELIANLYRRLLAEENHNDFLQKEIDALKTDIMNLRLVIDKLERELSECNERLFNEIETNYWNQERGEA
jgi:SMC interacting uncharacterized protein involved in chromosome segregation